MEWIKRLFKRNVSYMHFKKVTDNYYGMCGTQRLYIKTPCATGRYSYMTDSAVAKHMKDKGWVEIEGEEYDAWH